VVTVYVTNLTECYSVLAKIIRRTDSIIYVNIDIYVQFLLAFCPEFLKLGCVLKINIALNHLRFAIAHVTAFLPSVWDAGESFYLKY
jgi:hypothetical protein